MKTFDLSGQKRSALGKKETKKLRSEGGVPCVLYGLEENVHFSATSSALRKLVFTHEVYLVNLDIDGEKSQAIVKDIQFHPVSDDVSHIDFLAVSDEKPVKVSIPVKTTGFAVGVRNGGKLHLEMRYLTVNALAKDIPDRIEINITKMKIGDNLRVADIETDTLKLLNPKSAPVISVKSTRAAAGMVIEEEEDAEGEEGAEAASEEKAAE